MKNPQNQGFFEVPSEVSYVTETLEKTGFEAYLVGGCVRDKLLGRTPKDWDVATNAKPEEVQSLFAHTFYENTYGTVGVVNDTTGDPILRTIEVTTYRLEADYSDGRRPTQVSFSSSLEDDLKRRDFTINAFAYNVREGKLIDLYNGQADLEAKVLRTVGDPDERFLEDGLRVLRAIRIATELQFLIDPVTAESIQRNAGILVKISKERVRDEFVRILMSEHPRQGLLLTRKLGILSYITPELERGVGIDQNQAHKYDVWEHNLHTVQHAADKSWPLHIRLASLFHDISKPETRRWSNDKKDWTFHGHDVVGGRLTRKILTDLRFSNDVIESVSNLVRWHMFFSDPEQVTLSAVRRIIRNVGKEHIWDLMNLRVCDRIGTGRPKENPYRFRKYKSMVEEALRDPLTVGMLKINGGVVMEVTKTPPSPKIGYVLHALLEEVLEDPTKNTEEYLQKRAVELAKLEIEVLAKLGEQGKERKEETEAKNIKEIREKYWVE